MAGFIGPDSPIDEPNSSFPLADIAKKATKAALFPLQAPAKIAEPVAEAFIGPDAPIDDPESFNPDPSKGPAFPNMGNYPNDLNTSLSPTLDAFQAPFIAKDLLVGGVKLAGRMLPKNAARLKALEALDEVAKLPAAPELPGIGDAVPSGSAPKPLMGLERLQTARKDPITGNVHVGHNSGEVAQQMLNLSKEAQAKMEIDYADWLRTAQPGDRFEMGGGNYAIFKGGNGDFGNFVDVFGNDLPAAHPPKSTLSASVLTDEKMLRADMPQAAQDLREAHIKSKGFVDAKGQFIGPDEAVDRISGQGKEAGPAFARELPFASDKSGVVPRPPAEPAEGAISFTPRDIRDINKEAGTKLTGGEEQLPLSYRAKPKGVTVSTQDINDINKQTGTNIVPKPIDESTHTLGTIEKGVPTEPIKMPGPADTLPEGGKERIAAFATTKGTDLPQKNPFSTSSEMVTKVGDLKNVVRDQFQTGLKAEAKAEKAANDVFVDVKKKYGFEPESLDSKVLSKYMRNPNKAAAAEALRTHIGPDAEKYINAEKEIRVHFDRWRNDVNQVRRANGLQEVPYKDDYLPQIHESNVLSLLGKEDLIGTPKGQEIMDAMKSDADKLQQSKFVHLDEIAFKHLKHQGVPDIDDAIKGMETYGREAERLKALQPHINELRQTAESIKDTMPNLAKEYIERADHIAGKQHAWDLALKDTFGADKFQMFVDASNRMKSNLIEGNYGVPASQLLVLPSVAASVPVRSSMAATVRLMASKEFRHFLIANSPTIQLRFEGGIAQGLHKSALRGLLSKPSEMVDEYTLMYGLGAKYITGIRNGLSSAEAMKEAEQFASLTQHTLSKLNTAPILRSRTAQSALPFMNQVLTQGRYVTTQMMKGKPLGEKAMTAAKYIATAIAVSQVGKMLLGDKAHSSFEPSQYVPMGSAMEQGIGGPVVGGVGRMLKAGSLEQVLWQTFRNAMLYQKTIPAGLMVSKGVESIFRKKEKSKRRSD